MDICSRNEKLAIRRPAILVALALLLCSCKSTPPESMVTPPAGSKPPATTQQSSQPMRGIWLATVSRLDWPPVSSVNNSNPTSRARVQQQAMIDKLDHLQRLGINTVFFQVKPDGTALWPSKILPWSDLMTGKIGENPGYDPLQFMLDEAHKRGMKVHAWFNPYRVSVNTKPGTIRELNSTLSQQPASVYVQHRDWIRTSGDRFVLDPGIPEVQDWITSIVAEVVSRYPVDGVQFDDYFYTESPGSRLNDNETYRKYGGAFASNFALSKVSAEGKVYYLALVRDASVEMAQKEQTRQLIIAVDHLDRPVIVLDPERHIVQCNRAFTEMFGYCINEASGMQPDTLLNIPEFPADNRIRLQQLLWKTARDQDEFLLLTRTGEKIWIKASISPVYDVLAHLQNLVMTFSDITEERQIRQLEGNILAAMCSSPPFHEMGEIICRNIESVLNESHVSLFALRNGMPIHWASSSHGAEVQNAQSWSATIRQRDGAPAGILQIKTSSGAETSAFIERVADISQHMAALALEQEKSRQHIEQLIQFDPMTGLPNRNNLHNYLDDLVDKAVSPVVYLIGVDHIQDVIDSLGYAWADQALLEVVNRFREKLKPDQYLCRIEGASFVLVSLENDVSNITQIADELRNVVSKPIMIDDKPFPLTLSIGISYDVGKNRDYLLSTAHNAMDFIRKNGGNGWQFFSPAMNEMVKERLVLGAALKEAISNNQLKLVYQPQIFAETGELYGIEALARWYDPLHGHVPPSRFIPLAEEIGEIENIGRWVIAEACRQLAEWRSQNIHIPALSVNLSALHFRSNQLPNQVSDAMHAWGIDGHQLTVEITESMMMEHDTEIFKRIQILRDMGIGLSVDDFGTGFSGLSRLVSLPVTEIKIDKSFVDRCLTEKRILALLEAITSIGQSLNLTVVAEGVETKEQFEMLRKIHCRVIQGYFFSRPLPAEEIPGWMSSVLPLKI